MTKLIRLRLQRATFGLFVTTAVLVLWTGSALGAAGNGTWNGSSSGLWSLAGNWTGSVPGTGNTATFNGAGNGNTTLDLTGGLTINTILFDTASVAGYTIGTSGVGAQTLILNNSGAITASSTVAQNQLFNAAITLGTDTTAQTYTFTDNSAANSLTFAGNLTGAPSGGTAGTKTLAILTAPGNIAIGGVIAKGGATTLVLTKSGTGTLTLSGANTFNGSTTINLGTVVLDYSTQNNAKLTSAAALTLAGGIQLSGGSYSEAVASCTLSAGASSITQSSGTATLNLGAITRNAGSTLDVSADNIVLTTSPASGGGSILNAGSIAYGTFSGTDWAFKNAGNTAIVSLGTAGGSYTSTTTTTLGGGTYADVASGIDTTLAGNDSGSRTLRFNQSQARTINLNGNTATLTYGGILVTPNVGANLSTITGGTLQAGATPAELVIHQYNTSGGLTINSVIAGSAYKLTKSGPGTLTLGGANTYTGATYLNSGTLNLQNQNALQSSTLTLGGGNLVFDSSITGNAFTFGGLASPFSGPGYDLALQNNAGSPAAIALTVGGNNGSPTYNGLLSGPGSLIKTGTGTLTLNYGTNTFSGGTTVNAGILTFAAWSVNTTTILGTGPVTVNSPGTITFNREVLTNSLTLNSATVTSGNSFASTVSGPVTLGGTSTINVTGSLNLSGNMGGTGGFTKTGISIVPVSGINNYSGTTTISVGGLQFSKPQALYNGVTGNWTPANIIVASGASLGVNVGGPTDFTTTQVGTLLANLTTGINNNGLQSGSIFAFDDSNATGLLNFSGTIADSTGTAGTGPLSIRINLNGSTKPLQLSGANTYSGKTAVWAGAFLMASSLNYVTSGTWSPHTSSNLGVPSNAANGTIDLGNSQTQGGGTLIYTGPGETTDRVINFAANNGTGAQVIDQSGSGLLKFTSPFTSTGSAAVPFTIQGSTTGTGEIVGALPAFTGALTKAGTGTWTLDGANLNTGATTISGGLLRFNGVSMGVSAVTVSKSATGAALGGTGTIPGTVTLNVGDASNLGGAINLCDGAVSTLTLSSTLTFSGTATYPNYLYFDLGATTADKIAATGAVTSPAAGGAIVNLNQLAGTTLAAGNYSLVTGASGITPGNFSLATTRGFGSTFALGGSGTALQLTVAAASDRTATSAFWSGVSSANWSALGNWNTDASSNTGASSLPGYQGNVSFYTTTPTAGSLTTTLDADFDINSLNFTTAATSAVTISGTKTLAIEASNANGNTAGNGIYVSTPSSGTVTHTISAKVGLESSQTWTVNPSATLTVSGTVSDFGSGYSLTKAGTGTLTLNGVNTYSGGTTVNAGILGSAAGGTSSAFGTGPITLANGTTFQMTGATPVFNNPISLPSGSTTVPVPFGGGADVTLGGPISGAGGIIETSDASGRRLILTGNNTFSGGVTLSSSGNPANARLVIGSPTALGTGTLTCQMTGTSGGLENTTALTTGAGVANGIDIQSNFNVGNNSTANMLLSGTIYDVGSLTKLGTGTVILSGLNTYSGATLIQNGSVSVSSLNSVNGGTPLLTSSSLGAPTTVANGTISLGVSGSSGTAGTLVYTGTGETSDRVIKLPGRTVGGTIDQSGTGLLKFTSDLTVPGETSQTEAKTLTLQGSTTGTGEIGGKIVDSTLGTSGQLATSVTKAGSGTWTLSGANTYSGATTVSAGTLLVNGSTASGSAVTVSAGATCGGTGTIGGTATFSSGANAVFTVTPSGSGDNNSTLMTISGVMTYNANQVHLNLPANLPGGIYTLAASSATPVANGVFPTPVVDSGSFVSTYTAATISLDTINKKLILTVTAPSLVPTQLAITSVNGGVSPTAGVGFSVVVQSQDAGGVARNVTTSTNVTLSLNTGTGTLGGTLTGTIAANSSSVTISGVTYSKAESGVILTAANTGGTLTSGNSTAFNVSAALDHFAISAIPSAQAVGSPFTISTITAQDSTSATVTNFTGTVTFGGTAGVTGTSGAFTLGVLNDASVTPTVSGSGLTVTVSDNASPTPHTGSVTIGTITPAPSLFSWTNTISGNWNGAANWTNDQGAVVAPAPAGQTNYTLDFNQAGTYTASNNLNNGFLFNQLNFGGATLTLAGNDLAFTNNDGILPQFNQNSAVAITISNNLALDANTTFGGTGNGQVTLFGLISGTGTLTMTNSGTLEIASTTNTYSGGTIINNGTFWLGDVFGSSPLYNAALGTGPVTLNNGATLQLERVTATNALTLNGGTIIQNNGWGATWNGPVTLNANTPVNCIYAPGMTFNNTSGSISGAGGFTKTGSAALNLSGINSFTGDLTISGGSLVVGGSGQLGSGSYAGNITNNAAFTYNSSAGQTLSGVISGTGSLTDSGSGTLTLSAATSTYTGKTTVSASTLTVGAAPSNAGVAGPLGAPPTGANAIIDVANGATLYFNPGVQGAFATDRGINLAGGSGTTTLNFKQNDTIYTFNGAVTASGTGLKTLAIGTGINNNGDREAVVFNGAIPNVSDGSALSLQVTFTTQSGNPSYVSLGAGGTFTGPITLVKGANVSAAYLTIGGVYYQTGVGNVNTPGSGQLGGGNYAGAISLDTSTILNYNSTANQILAGAISGPGALTVSGPGTLTLSSVANSYTGATTVSAGTLLVNGSTAAGSAVTTQSGGTLGGTGTIGGNVTYSTGALAVFTEGAPLTISGSLTLNGNTVHLALPANLGLGTYTLATYNTSGSAGTFATLPVVDSGSLLVPGASVTVATGGGVVTLTVSKATPVVSVPLTATPITYGQGLSNSIVSGTFTNAAGGSVPGSFAFATPGLTPPVGTNLQSVIFTPTDSTDYNTVTTSVSVAVLPAASTTLVVGAPNPSLPGSNVTFTATVSSVTPGIGTPTNQVQFVTNGTAATTAYLDVNGQATFSTALLPHGSNAIQVQYISDGNFLASTGSVVQVVNTPPVATNILMGALSGQPSTLQIIGGKHAPTDADEDPLTVTAAGPAANGTVATDGTNVTYTSANTFTGTDTFPYTVSDDYGGSCTNTVTVTVAANGVGFNQISADANGMTYAGIPGFNYALDYASSLTPPVVWAPVVTNAASDTGVVTFTNTATGFYRTRWVP